MELLRYSMKIRNARTRANFLVDQRLKLSPAFHETHTFELPKKEQ